MRLYGNGWFTRKFQISVTHGKNLCLIKTYNYHLLVKLIREERMKVEDDANEISVEEIVQVGH